MATIAHPITAEEFERIPEPSGIKIELVKGAVFEVSRGNLSHEIVKARIFRRLAVYAETNSSWAPMSETMFRLGNQDEYIPDVSMIRSERFSDQSMDKPFHGAPDIAIEVVSSESMSHVEAKIQAYFREGASAVWAAILTQRIIRVFAKDGSSRRLQSGDLLQDPDLLPGFQVPVADLFEGV